MTRPPTTRFEELRAWLQRRGLVVSTAGVALSVAALIAWTCLESPKYPQLARFGDDVEYMLSAQSFIRHGSFDYRPGDEADVLAQLPKKWRGSAGLKYQPPRPHGYFEARDGRLFGWHFWTYPAAVAPLKAMLDRDGRGALAFHYANILFFCVALATFLQLRAAPRLWLTLLPLAFFTPVLWFLPLVHTEPFVFALGLIALTSWLAERRVLAILFMSLAATQFQPLAVISFALCADSLWRYRAQRRWFAIAGSLLAASVALIPNLFYYYHYGTPSVVTREGFAASHLTSFAKLASMFVDLNTGLLVYLPGVLLLFGASVIAALRSSFRERSILPLLVPASVLVALWGSTSARIWNYHTQGISRYALYATPALLLSIGLSLRAARPGRLWLGLFALALGLQAAVHRQWGLFEYRGNNNLQHNELALFVLERWPRLYSPPPEIFCSRTLHRRCWLDYGSGHVTPEFLPAILLDGSAKPVKALVRPCDPESTLRVRNSWSDAERERIQTTARDCGDGAPRYLDFR